jgi:hypothetical protein
MRVRISAQLAVVMAAIFAIISFGFAFTGYSAIDGIADPQQVADAKGYAGFWAFLGCVALAMGAISVWILRTQEGGDDA